MQKISLSLIALVIAANALSQVTKPIPKPVQPLKTGIDTISYVLGEIAAYGLINQGLGDIKMNSTIFLKAVTDILSKKNPILSDSVANSCLNNYLTKSQTEKIKPAIDAGAKFLAQNKLKPGIKTTPSGLQYEVVREGTGIKPTAVDTFVANYRGTLLDGSEFDNSYSRGMPLTLGVGQVIPGWTEGLQLMPVGSKYIFWIPYNLGYGERGMGSQIPGGAMLKFEVELLDVKKKQ